MEGGRIRKSEGRFFFLSVPRQGTIHGDDLDSTRGLLADPRRAAYPALMAFAALAGLAVLILLANTAIVGSAYTLQRFFTHRLQGRPPVWTRDLRAEDLARTLADEHTPSEAACTHKPALNDFGMS